MSKYDIDESFGLRASVTVPVNQPIAGFSRLALGNMHEILNKIKGITVKTYKVDACDGQIDLHMIYPDSSQYNSGFPSSSESSAKMPVIIDIHGGGFVFDAAPHMYELAARYAVETGCVVALPRYRLTPRHKYPTQINDCISVYNWIKNNADNIYINNSKIALMGDSCGGYLAITVANHAVFNGDKLLFQLLIYPVTDTRMCTESMQLYKDTPVWNARNNRSMWKMYFGKSDIDRDTESWLLRELPEGLPATYIETAEFDCLHDEALMYADRLKNMNVPVEINNTKGTMHGFDETACDITENAVVKRIDFMKKNL